MDNVSIVCNGTRVIGLGNIVTEGAIPVMEGKSHFVQNTWWYKRTHFHYV
jgi:malic enzyme